MKPVEIFKRFNPDANIFLWKHKEKDQWFVEVRYLKNLFEVTFTEDSMMPVGPSNTALGQHLWKYYFDKR